jgi:hypothetical protein
MRENKELSQKVGLLPGMGVYKFFRVIYGYQENGLSFIQAKRKKPFLSSQIFINNDYGFNQEVEQELGSYFDYSEKGLKLKKQVQETLRQKSLPNSGKITDFLKLCLRYCSRSKVKQNSF